MECVYARRVNMCTLNYHKQIEQPKVEKEIGFSIPNCPSSS